MWKEKIRERGIEDQERGKYREKKTAKNILGENSGRGWPTLSTTSEPLRPEDSRHASH